MSEARIVSVNVGLPREVKVRDGVVFTGIFKAPVAGRVKVGMLNLAGDGQADLSVHGGPDKAICCYPVEHYQSWRAELPDIALDWGMFGENLTVQGLHEETVYIGDQFRIGSATVQVTQPRMPCYKLGLRFSRLDMVRRFWASGRSGSYLRVLEEGEVGAGDTVELRSVGAELITVAEALPSRGD